MEEKSALVAQLAERRFRKSQLFIMDKSSFKEWLQSQGKSKNTVKQTVNNAARYYHVLDSGDATELMTLSPRNKHHAMSALSSLSKYQGRYDHWQHIRQRYNLKWTSGNNSLQSLERFFNPEMSLDHMFQKVKGMIAVLPVEMGLIIRHCTITGLRPSEAVESAKILTTGKQLFTQYYNPEQQTLEHFKFPDVFLRQTKKAYLSFITLDNLQPIAQIGAKTPTWNAIRQTCNRRKINMDMRFCRRIFASWLVQSGIDPTTVDLLQGRVPPSVLARHYQTPSSDLKHKVLQAVGRLKDELEK